MCQNFAQQLFDTRLLKFSFQIFGTHPNLQTQTQFQTCRVHSHALQRESAKQGQRQLFYIAIPYSVHTCKEEKKSLAYPP